MAVLAAAWGLLLPSAGCVTPRKAPSVPRPDHVVVVVEENHSYWDIFGNVAEAPYINELARQGASFSRFAAVTHPSQPNYVALFSGSTQGVTDDSCPHFLTGPNLASKLTDAGLTFAGYSESMPTTGFTGCDYGDYARRHNPWVNFANVPRAANRPWTAFPRDGAKLPTLSFVIPNVRNDMHKGGVRRADTWLREHLGGYARWAMTHRSLLVVTWDEDDGGDGSPNLIPTIIVGEQVRPGTYHEKASLYRLLRTLLDAYDLPAIGHSAEVGPIKNVWKRARPANGSQA